MALRTQGLYLITPGLYLIVFANFPLFLALDRINSICFLAPEVEGLPPAGQNFKLKTHRFQKMCRRSMLLQNIYRKSTEIVGKQ